jgi:hypothetical protein
MLEIDFCYSTYAASALFLTQHRVAKITFLSYYFPVGADVLPVMTAEAAVEVEMAKVIGECLPVQLHFWKSRSPVDLLDFTNGASNLHLFVVATECLEIES